MRALILSALLAPFGVLAQVADKAPTCLPNYFTSAGTTGVVGWITWQCRAQAKTQRHWDRFYVFVSSPLALNDAMAAVADKARKGDNTALSAGAALRTDSIYSAKFAAAKRDADAAAAKQDQIAMWVSSEGNRPCACDVRHAEIGALWSCPLVTDIQGPSVTCRPQ